MTGSALYDTYARAPLAFERGEGSWLMTEDGTRFLDFAAGIAVNSLGHANPRLVTALTEQAQKLWHVSNLYEVPGQNSLADKLTANTFADKVFFTNSGTEAIECAIKTARKYHHACGNPQRFRILTFEGAFHGRSLGAIAAGGQQKYLEGFGPKAEGFDQIPIGDVEALKKAITPETAALLVEPIQGEGGIRVVPNEMLRKMRDICDANGILMVLDEIQCGIGRTGRLFAHEWAGIEPDIMAVAKGIGGGFPVGACLATEEAAKGMVAGTHGTTYGGNPLAMKVAGAVLEIVLEDGFLDSINSKALLLKQGLASVADEFPDIFEEIRGFGLMLGMKCRVNNTDLVAALRDHRMLTVPAGDNVVRLLPPLTVSEEEIRLALDCLRTAAAALSKAGLKTA